MRKPEKFNPYFQFMDLVNTITHESAQSTVFHLSLGDLLDQYESIQYLGQLKTRKPSKFLEVSLFFIGLQTYQMVVRL